MESITGYLTMILYETISQKLIDLDKPVYDPEDMDSIEMIAKALSRTRRFNQRIDYTVAEHSMWMAKHFADPYMRLQCLLHDAPEKITGDPPSPIVEMCNRPDGSNPIKEIQDKILDALLRRYDIEKMHWAQEKAIKAFDSLSLFVEKRDYIGSENVWPGESSFQEAVCAQPTIKHNPNELEIARQFVDMFNEALKEYRELKKQWLNSQDQEMMETAKNQ